MTKKHRLKNDQTSFSLKKKTLKTFFISLYSFKKFKINKKHKKIAQKNFYLSYII